MFVLSKMQYKMLIIHAKYTKVKSLVCCVALCVSESWVVKRQTKTKENWTILKCGWKNKYHFVLTLSKGYRFVYMHTYSMLLQLQPDATLPGNEVLVVVHM